LILHQCAQTFDIALVDPTGSLKLDRQLQVADYQVHFKAGTRAPKRERQKLLRISYLCANLFDQKVFKRAAEFYLAKMIGEVFKDFERGILNKKSWVDGHR